ncbi:MAG: hypothetical protein H0X50_02495, partial [Nitrosopumilus sp.]|nr:hypothetical protein [Nitrosopumilus sp.]
PKLPDAPQEFASGLDSELMRLTQELQTVSKRKIIDSGPYSTNTSDRTVSTYNANADTIEEPKN